MDERIIERARRIAAAEISYFAGNKLIDYTYKTYCQNQEIGPKWIQIAEMIDKYKGDTE